MFSHYNPNPQGNRVGDCVVRAVSKAVDKSWEDTYIELTIQGYIMGDLLSSNGVWGAYLRANGFDRGVVSADCPDCYTVADFANEQDSGVFVVGTGTHAVCIVDGVIFDAWDSSAERPVYFYHKNNYKHERGAE